MPHIIRLPNGKTSIAHCPPGKCGLPRTLEVLGATLVCDVAMSALPTDRYFRNAWVCNGSTMVVDMAQARDIHMAHIRVARDAKLQASDVAMVRAMEQGNSAELSTLSLERQRLRDIPQSLDLMLASTPEDLKAIDPFVDPPTK